VIADTFTDVDGDTVALGYDHHDVYGSCVEISLVEADSGDFKVSTLTRDEFERLVAWGVRYLAATNVPAASGSAGAVALDVACGETATSSAAPRDPRTF
jgi:hypothetical protein